MNIQNRTADWLNPSNVPAWVDLPHAEIEFNVPVYLGSNLISEIEAVVTVYRDEAMIWGIGEMMIEGNKGRTIVEQAHNGWPVTHEHFLANAIVRELDENPVVQAMAEEAVDKAEREWRS